MTTETQYFAAGIVEDSYSLSVARKQTLTSLLRLLNAYRNESDYTVLSHVTSVSKPFATSNEIIYLVSLIDSMVSTIVLNIKYMHPF